MRRREGGEGGGKGGKLERRPVARWGRNPVAGWGRVETCAQILTPSSPSVGKKKKLRKKFKKERNETPFLKKSSCKLRGWLRFVLNYILVLSFTKMFDPLTIKK